MEVDPYWDVLNRLVAEAESPGGTPAIPREVLGGSSGVSPAGIMAA